jgi:hypothetical protein
MKVISNAEELNKEFQRLMEKYNYFYWSLAWADFNFSHCKSLVKYSGKIKRISVGLTFYGTNVQFLKKFKSHAGVNFVLSTQGTFHPKVYLFQNSDKEFEILIGSSNFTKAAFSKNTEFNVLIGSKDPNAKQIYKDTINFINKQWQDGRIINNEFIKNYAAQKLKVKTIQSIPSEGIISAVDNKTWTQYYNDIRNSKTQSHIKLLNWVANEFEKQPKFHKMDIDTRKIIAGFGQPSDEVSIGCFGTTDARGNFKNAIIERPEIITRSLSKVPKEGIVTERHYKQFLKEFSKVSNSNELACATRILCLWRPDYFVNFNGKNKASLCKELRISKQKVNYDTYWAMVVQPLISSQWWQGKSNLRTEKEFTIYNYRVALLDCIHYDWT